MIQKIDTINNDNNAENQTLSNDIKINDAKFENNSAVVKSAKKILSKHKYAFKVLAE